MCMFMYMKERVDTMHLSLPRDGMHTCVLLHTYIHKCIHMYTQMHIYVVIMYLYVHIYASTRCISLRKYTHVCTYIHMYTQMY